MKIRQSAFLLGLLTPLTLSAQDGETIPKSLQRIVAVENVCAWPNLTSMPDGTIIAVIHNQPAHGLLEGDVDCYASTDGAKWEKRSTVTAHEPNTVRMNHAAGLAKNGDLLVLCSGWTDLKQPQRPKQAKFRDDILRPWVMRSSDAGRTWSKHADFPAAETGWSEQIPFGDIWVGADGALHTSCYQGHYADPGKGTKTDRWRSWHFRSADDGRTWKAMSIIGPMHNETDIFPLGGKRWMAVARIDANELFVSEDDGLTWEGPRRVTEKNEINGHLMRLKDGRLLLTYGVRIKDQQGVCAKWSADGGQTWSAPLRLAKADNGDCGYPSSVQRSDGKIVTAYYAKGSPECDHYHMGVSIWDSP